MRPTDWNLLLARIADGVCTPFLGAGAAAHALPLGGQIAERWAREIEYPLDDPHDLARVAQFLAVDQDDAMYPKERLAKELASLPGPDLAAAGEPHAVL